VLSHNAKSKAISHETLFYTGALWVFSFFVYFMRKNVFGRQLKRDSNERKALFKSLLSSLVLYESIQTTEAKAKAIKSDADKLITKAKKGGLHAYRLVEPELYTDAVKKLLNTIAPRFTNRQGGYTRIIRVGRRLKDNGQEVIIEWTEKSTGLIRQPADQTKEPATSKPQKSAKKETKAKAPRKTDEKKETKGKDK
jgi:large subunit ribosomal protein L17